MKLPLKCLFVLLGSFLFVACNYAASNNELVTTVARLDRARILELAAEAMNDRPPAITDHRATNSAGGPHDFFSQADYTWPNPTNKNHLPYVNRDGETNPKNFEYHRMAMRNMKDDVAALAAAYALTGDEKYIPKAEQFLRFFFLNESTKMNPNLDYAQAVLGVATGRSYGIIDTLHLAELPVAVRFLEKSPKFDSAVDAGLKKWFTDYIHWMTTATNGVKEMNAANNHSIAYFVQLASFADFVGDQKTLDMCRERFKTVLLPRQMTNDGSFPLELKRTKPYGYSIFQADNVAILCVLLSTPQEDLWKFQLPNGVTPLKSTEFIYPYLADKSRWLADGRGKDVAHWDGWPAREPCLLFAYAKTGDGKYLDLWEKLKPDPKDLEVRRNIAITQPLLWIAKPAEVPLFSGKAARLN
jgi:hypothetical protein